MMSVSSVISFRSYSAEGPPVIVIHGGPGAAGYMAPVARGLADRFTVLEPLQRRSGDEPLTVARHVADLLEFVESRCPGDHPALIGSSWGAMLALAFAAEHPEMTGPLALIGCGTFDHSARNQMKATIDSRMDLELRHSFKRLTLDVTDPDERLRAMGELILPLYSYDLITQDLEMVSCDAASNRESWEDMVRLQDEGLYPAAFQAIDVPVLMLHGAVDPHPGRMIRESLKPYIPQLEYHEWSHCGHYPWLEGKVREEFFDKLRQWLEAAMERQS